MASSQEFNREGRAVVKGLGVVCAICVALLVGSQTRAEPKATAKTASSTPVVTITVPSIKHVYGDLKLLFDMAHDEKGYNTFIETLDEFLVGVDETSPCGARLVMSDGGMSMVVSAPVKDEASFQKFLANLWDLDVKTAPPPTRSRGQMPKSVQDKMRTHKLEHNERILYGLTEGFLRDEKGQIHLGGTLDAVRSVHGGLPAPSAKSAGVTIDIAGDVDPAQRRAAFEKSKDDLLSRPNRKDFSNDANFELAKAMADFQLAKIELLVADSSQLHAVYSISHEKKTSQFDGQVVPAKNTPLAKIVSRIGQEPDAFAGISNDNAELVANINMPNDPNLGRALKNVAAKAKAAADARIDESSKVEQSQKADDKQFAELVFEVASDIAGMDTFNGVARIWTGNEGKLTSLTAARVPHGEKYRELLRKFQHREQAPQKIQGVEVHKLVNARLQKDAPELFGSDGAIYVATSDKAIWFAAGPDAMQRLEQAVEVTLPGKGATSGGSEGKQAIDLHTNLQALAAAWEAIGTRTNPGSDGSKRKSESKPANDSKSSKRPAKRLTKQSDAEDGKSEDKKVAAASVVSDLELHKIAGKTFKQGDGRLTMSLTGDGDKAKVSITCDEGILRFVGNVLSKFTEENLAD